MKIVFVNPVGAMGGAERAMLTIMAALLTDPSIQLHLIVGTDGPLVKNAEDLGVKVETLKLPDKVSQLGDSALQGKNRITAVLVLWQVTTILPAIGQYLIKLRQAIQELDPDIIHSNGIKTHILAGLVNSTRVPVVWHIHDFYSKRPLMARVLRWMSDRATGGIAISEAVAQDAKATLPHLPIEVIYNAVDTTHFTPSPHPPIPPSPHPLNIGLVATFARWKGHNIFLEAAAQVVRTRPDINVRFYVVGGPIYQTKGSQFSEQELRDKAADLQIANKVDFIGFQQNIADIYRWLDIVVHASTQPEPFGLAIVEAMACGKPVIVSQAGGAAELFTHNYDAIGVPPGDSTALASAIQQLVDNSQQRQYLAENARLTVLKRFSHDRIGEQITNVYLRNLQLRSPTLRKLL